MDYDAAESLRRTHPGWRLLAADHAALVVSGGRARLAAQVLSGRQRGSLRFGASVRLGQERIGFGWVERALRVVG